MKLKVVVDIDGATATLCENNKTACRFVASYEGQTGWHCSLFDDVLLEEDPVTYRSVRCPACLKAGDQGGEGNGD